MKCVEASKKAPHGEGREKRRGEKGEPYRIDRGKNCQVR